MIIIADVAVVAFRTCMSTGQGEQCIMPREKGRFPSRIRAMAFQAFRGDPCSCVVGIGGGVKIGLMAGKAVGGYV